MVLATMDIIPKITDVIYKVLRGIQVTRIVRTCSAPRAENDAPG